MKEKNGKFVDEVFWYLVLAIVLSTAFVVVFNFT